MWSRAAVRHTRGVEAPDDTVYARIVADLEDRFGATFDHGEVSAAVDRARAEIEPESRHPEFLRILVTKHARDHLAAAAKRHGRIPHTVPHLLFVCEHNSVRSQMAAALAEHHGGERVHVHSAGRQRGGPLRPIVQEVLAEKGIRLEHAYASDITDDIVHAADVIVEIGASLPEVPGKVHVQWDVADPADGDPEEFRAARDELERRVLDLFESLGVPVEAGREQGTA